MTIVQLGLWAAGSLLIAVGYFRAIRPWRRYQDLRAQDDNSARYAAWRGGVRADEKTGASVAMEFLKRQVQVGAGIAGVGVVLVILGFVLR
jgi:hypothetical protein